jgi:hypothetical protein
MLSTTTRAVAILLVLVLFFAWSSIHAPITHADPSASGADAPYPLNHTFDGNSHTVDVGLTNGDFAANSVSAAAPDNADFNSAISFVGTPPTNSDFASGDLTGWTPTNNVSVQSNTPQGYYGQMGGWSMLTTAAFNVDNAAQVFTFTLGYFGPYTQNQVDVWVLHGSGYSTQTYLTTYSCWFCNGVWWGWLTANAEAYRGQSVKLIFNSASAGTTALDDVNQAIELPGYDLSGNVRRYGDGAGNDYAHLDGGAAITSSAVTVPSDADFLKLDIHGDDNAGLSKVSVAILTGTGFGTTNWVITQQYMPYGWSTQWISLESYKGQTVKIVVGENQGGIGVDNIDLWNEVPGWSTAGSVSHVRDGTSDYVINRGWLITPPIDLTDETQQLAFRWRSNGSWVDEYYIDVLSGSDFSTETHVVFKYGYNTDWQQMTVGLSQFAGQTVKIRLKGTSGPIRNMTSSKTMKAT